MEYDEQRQREVVARAAKRAPEPPHPLLALQQGVGNAAVSRAILARNRNMIQQQYDKARKERDTFVAAGKKGPQTYNPSTNNADNYYGGFDVEYDPAKGELHVTLKGAVLFLAGMTLDATGPRRRPVEPSAADRRRRGARSTGCRRPTRAAEVGQVDVVERGRAGRQRRAGLPRRLQELGRGRVAQEASVPLHEEVLGGPRRGDARSRSRSAKVADAAGKAGDQHMLVNAHKVREGLRRRRRRRQPATRRGRRRLRQRHERHVRGRRPAQGRAAARASVHFQSGKGLLTPASVGHGVAARQGDAERGAGLHDRDRQPDGAGPGQGRRAAQGPLRRGARPPQAGRPAWTPSRVPPWSRTAARARAGTITVGDRRRADGRGARVRPHVRARRRVHRRRRVRRRQEDRAHRLRGGRRARRARCTRSPTAS